MSKTDKYYRIVQGVVFKARSTFFRCGWIYIKNQTGGNKIIPPVRWYPSYDESDVKTYFNYIKTSFHRVASIDDSTFNLVAK